MTNQQAYNAVRKYFPISSDFPRNICAMPILKYTGYILCRDTDCNIDCLVKVECAHLMQAEDDITTLEFKYKATQ